MPIAVAFAKKINVIGFDLNAKKIELYKSGIDPTHEVGDEEVKNTTVNSRLMKRSCVKQSSTSLLFRLPSMMTTLQT